MLLDTGRSRGRQSNNTESVPFVVTQFIHSLSQTRLDTTIHIKMK